MYADKLMYWASIENPAIKVASLNGSGQVTLLNESDADYRGITLYNNCLYICDSSRRSVFYRTTSAVYISCRNSARPSHACFVTKPYNALRKF